MHCLPSFLNSITDSSDVLLFSFARYVQFFPVIAPPMDGLYLSHVVVTMIFRSSSSRISRVILPCHQHITPASRTGRRIRLKAVQLCLNARKTTAAHRIWYVRNELSPRALQFSFSAPSDPKRALRSLQVCDGTLQSDLLGATQRS